MPTSTITLPNGNVVTLVALPASPAPKMVEPWVFDSVAAISFPFTGQTQRQASTGADQWGMMVTYPPMLERIASPILAWLLQMRGMARGVLMPPPEYTGLTGSPSGTPVCVGAQPAGSTTLSTSGWTHSAAGLLKPWDCIQIGYRLHRVLDAVASDGSGDATFEIWPSLRDSLTGGETIVTANPVGLFGLAQNKRNWTTEGPTREVALSFPLVEWR